MLYCLCVSLVSLNGDDKPKQKTSESGDNIEDNLTKEGVSEGDLTAKEADGSLSDITGKDGDSDDQRNVGENDSQSEGEERNLKHSRSTDDPDYDNAGSKRFCPTSQ